MAFEGFKRAKRENVQLLIGLIGGTGSGKTYSAMKLAEELSGGATFAVIDTEAGRANHYADEFNFDHGEIVAPFRPDTYIEAIVAAEAAGYPVVVVDSMSHEHAGEGGLLDWHDELLEEMVSRSKGPEWKARQSNTMRAWIEPKMSHKRMVSRLLQLRCHVILCFRAEPKSKPMTVNGKTEIVDLGMQPVCAKGFEFELTCSFLLGHEKPGLPTNPLKLPEQLRKYFPPDKPIGAESGRGLLAWSKGAGTKQSPELAHVLELIEAASTTEELGRVTTAAAQLEDDEQKTARMAYKAKLDKLKAEQ